VVEVEVLEEVVEMVHALDILLQVVRVDLADIMIQV
jgi:hypothetical protein